MCIRDSTKIEYANKADEQVPGAKPGAPAPAATATTPAAPAPAGHDDANARGVAGLK